MSIIKYSKVRYYLSHLIGVRNIFSNRKITPKNMEYESFILRGRNNSVVKSTAILRSVSIDITGSNNEVIFGDGTKAVDLEVYINGSNNKIKIGKDCRFVKGGSLWVEDNECEIIIGDSTSFISAHLAATESKSKITIGRDCMFAYDIDVRTGDSHSILDVDSGKRINYAADVSIGDHVWIASHVSILKGVNIMDNCIVGAGSIVTKSYEDSNVIYAGNPAKIVKKNITWSRERL